MSEKEVHEVGGESNQCLKEPPVDPELDEKGRLTDGEIEKRRDFLPEAGVFQMNDHTTIRYACLSQRGFYPNNLHKPNQDSIGVKLGLGGSEHDAFVAVYDGHGEEGHKCAQFAMTELPKSIAKNLAKQVSSRSVAKPSGKRISFFGRLQSTPASKPSNASQKTKPARKSFFKPAFKEVESSLTASDLEYHPESDKRDSTPRIVEEGSDENKEDSEKSLGPGVPERPKHDTKSVQDICLNSFLEVDSLLHNNAAVDDSNSGTTCIGALFYDNKITICNVGDSRAILAKKPAKEGEDLIAVELSNDQTPFRKDETTRVKKAGGVVATLDQLDGIEKMHTNWVKEDIQSYDDAEPPRVWAKNKKFGVLSTRSIGDSAVGKVGVIAEPEMKTITLTRDTTMIILASDGVFEFLDSEVVIDFCAEYDDPLEACRNVASKSYEAWLDRDVRTDDISIMCMFVDHS